MSRNYFRFTKYLVKDLKKQIHKEFELFELRKKFPTLAIEEDVQIKNSDRLRVGKNVIIQKGTILHCGGMEWSNYKGFIKIGRDSVISPYCVFYGAGGIEIGERFDCGPGVMVFSSRTDYPRGCRRKNVKHLLKEVVIGDDVTLFANVIINIGIHIGNGAVVGAGSVVLSDIPSKEFWAGIPAKMINKIDAGEGKKNEGT